MPHSLRLGFGGACQELKPSPFRWLHSQVPQLARISSVRKPATSNAMWNVNNYLPQILQCLTEALGLLLGSMTPMLPWNVDIATLCKVETSRQKSIGRQCWHLNCLCKLHQNCEDLQWTCSWRSFQAFCLRTRASDAADLEPIENLIILLTSSHFCLKVCLGQCLLLHDLWNISKRLACWSHKGLLHYKDIC